MLEQQQPDTEPTEEQIDQSAPNGGGSLTKRPSLIPEPVQLLQADDPRRTRYLEAMMVCNAAFVPAGAQGSVASTYVLMSRAADLGLPWTYGLSVMYMTEGGSIGIKTEALIAVLLRDGFTVEWRESTPEKATVFLKRPDAEQGQEFTWTKEDADTYMVYIRKELKPLSSKWNWNGPKKRQVLLRYRAFMEGVRIVAPDKVGGLVNEDEIEEIQEREGVINVTPVTTADLEQQSGAGDNGVGDDKIRAEDQTNLRKTYDIYGFSAEETTAFLKEVSEKAKDADDAQKMIAARIGEITSKEVKPENRRGRKSGSRKKVSPMEKAKTDPPAETPAEEPKQAEPQPEEPEEAEKPAAPGKYEPVPETETERRAKEEHDRRMKYGKPSQATLPSDDFGDDW